MALSLILHPRGNRACHFVNCLLSYCRLTWQSCLCFWVGTLGRNVQLDYLKPLHDAFRRKLCFVEASSKVAKSQSTWVWPFRKRFNTPI